MTSKHSDQISWPFYERETPQIVIEDMVEWPDRSSDSQMTAFSSGLFLLDWEFPLWQGANEVMTTLSTTTEGAYVSVSETYSGSLTDAAVISGIHDEAQRTVSRSPKDQAFSPSVSNSPPLYNEDPHGSKSPETFPFKHFVACGEHVHNLDVADRCGMGKLELKQDRVERRRRQNRSSQRRYRERKDAKVQAAQDEVSEMKKTCTELQAHCSRLAQENIRLKAHCRDMEAAYMVSTAAPFYTISKSARSCSVSTSTVLEETMDAMNIQASEEVFQHDPIWS